MSDSALGVILVAGFAVLSILSVRALIDAGFGFVVSSITGEVMRERKRHETEVSGSISGHGGGSHSSGYVTSSVSSKTTRVQEIFLRLPNGKEREISFTDVDLPSREGNQLSVLYLARAGAGNSVVAYHNHATDRSVVFPRVITDVTRPPIRGVVLLWGSFIFLYALLIWWADGGFGESGMASAFITAGLIAVVAAVVAAVILRLAAKLRGGRRMAAVRASIEAEIAAVENE